MIESERNYYIESMSAYSNFEDLDSFDDDKSFEEIIFTKKRKPNYKKRALESIREENESILEVSAVSMELSLDSSSEDRDPEDYVRDPLNPSELNVEILKRRKLQQYLAEGLNQREIDDRLNREFNLKEDIVDSGRRIYKDQLKNLISEEVFEWIFGDSQNYFDFSRVFSEHRMSDLASAIYLNCESVEKDPRNLFHQFYFLKAFGERATGKLEFVDRLALDSVLVPRTDLSLEQLYFEIEHLFKSKFKNGKCDFCRALAKFPVITKADIKAFKKRLRRRQDAEQASNDPKALICSHVSKIQNYWGYFSGIYKTVVNQDYNDEDAIVNSIYDVLERCLGMVNAINILWQIAVSDSQSPLQTHIFDLVVVKASKLGFEAKGPEETYSVMVHESEMRRREEQSILIDRVSDFAELFRVMIDASMQVLDQVIDKKWAAKSSKRRRLLAELVESRGDLRIVNQIKDLVANHMFVNLIDLKNLEEHFLGKSIDKFVWNKLYFSTKRDIIFLLKKISLRDVGLLFFYCVFVFWKISKKQLKLTVHYKGDSSLLALYCMYRGNYFKFRNRFQFRPILVSAQNFARFQSQIDHKQFKKHKKSPFEYEKDNQWQKIGKRDEKSKRRENYNLENLIYSKAIQGHYFESVSEYDSKRMKKKEKQKLEEKERGGEGEISRIEDKFVEGLRQRKKKDPKKAQRRSEGPGQWGRPPKRRPAKKGAEAEDFPSVSEPQNLTDLDITGEFSQDRSLDSELYNNLIEKIGEGKQVKKGTLKERQQKKMQNLSFKKREETQKKGNTKKNLIFVKEAVALAKEDMERALDSDDSDEELKRKVNFNETRKGPNLREEDFPSLGGDFGQTEDFMGSRSQMYRGSEFGKSSGWGSTNQSSLSKSQSTKKESFQYANKGLQKMWQDPEFTVPNEQFVIPNQMKKKKKKRRRRKK